MKELSTFAAALAVAALFPLAGAAQQTTPAPQPETAQQPRQRTARPQLTDQQREQMRTLHEAERASGETSRRELHELHTQLEKELSAATLNNGRINELRGAIVQKETALASARLDRRAKIAGMLTPEQRQAFGERGVNRMSGRDGGRGEMRQRMRGQRGQPAQRRQGRGAGRMERAPGARGQMMRQRGGDAQLRERISRLEAQLEELRKKIK
ncbi:MAG: periplasmic heavy metal sensor [Acidobacteriota bacterium]|nr:periplasmic heavy metal sensor [Acidobacteriota bacterium]